MAGANLDGNDLSYYLDDNDYLLLTSNLKAPAMPCSPFRKFWDEREYMREYIQPFGSNGVNALGFYKGEPRTLNSVSLCHTAPYLFIICSQDFIFFN